MRLAEEEVIQVQECTEDPGQEGYTNPNWLTNFLTIFGMGGYALLVLFYPTLERIVVCLLVVLALMLPTQYKI